MGKVVVWGRDTVVEDIMGELGAFPALKLGQAKLNSKRDVQWESPTVLTQSHTRF